MIYSGGTRVADLTVVQHLNRQKSVIKLKSESVTQRRRHPILRVVLLVFLVVFGLLLVERWRGQWALSRWKHRMAAKGEIFEANRIWPRPSAQSLVFSNELQRAVGQLPPGLSRFAGQISAIVVQEPGIARRGSQEPSPSLVSPANEGNTWEELELEVRHAEPSLQLLRRILRDPPADRGYEILPRLESLTIPNFVSSRRAAQALQAAVMFNLHEGDLEGAKNNLVALARFTKLYAADPDLVNHMIRIAILGLSTEVAWDALQADGWTDEQLAELQEAFQCDPLLAQMPRTLEAQRASRLFELNWLSSHSYLAWVGRYRSFYEALGHKIQNADDPVALVTRYFREWVFHPVWKFAWADQEELEYLKNAHRELDILREAAKTGSGHELSQRMDSCLKAYRPPAACWRFYLIVPWADQSSEGFGAFRDKREYPYANFTRAWSTSMKNLTLCHLMTTAICLKRYELRHGKPPASLGALVPDLVAEVPRDFMDGQLLRYKVRPDGTYCLYSVADDAQDDHGTPTPPADGDQPPSTWGGRDWVWPRAVH